MKRGYTLIELVLAVTLVGIVVGITAPFLLSYQRSSILISDTNLVQESLKRAQILARSSSEESNWGTRVTNSNITIYMGNSYLTRNSSYDEVLSVSDIVTVSGTTEYNFDLLTGNTSDVGTITLTVDSKTKDINVNEKGLVAQ